MLFERIPPPVELKDLLECFWIAENDDPTPVTEKIIPDGFPEIIFHYGDPYRIRLRDQWELQSRTLLAGQITKYFYLENCGVSKVLGVKLKPGAITQLYGIAANTLVDKVVDLSAAVGMSNTLLTQITGTTENYSIRISALNKYFHSIRANFKAGIVEKAIETIFATKGLVSIEKLARSVYVSERHLERTFRHYVGLSPKFYCRIIRFSYIFQCMQQKDSSWSDIVHETGFYDQSHFIRNFRSFTGEEPSSYVFEKNSLANFFMKKKES